MTAETNLLSDKDYNAWLPKIDENWPGSIMATLIFRGNKKVFILHEFKISPNSTSILAHLLFKKSKSL